MTKRTLACLLLAVSFTHVAVALPDLVVTQVEISPAAPVDGTPVTVSATVENVGQDKVDRPFFVRITLDGYEIDLVPFTSLGEGRHRDVTTTWTATVGPHVLAVEADAPFGRVEETNEENNTSTLTVDVRLDEETMNALAPLKIAVARFDDAGSAGFINAGRGVADALSNRLRASGLRIVDREELDATLQAQELNPMLREDVAAAARSLDADLVVLGSVLDIEVDEASIDLGLLRVNSAAATALLSADVADAATGGSLSSVTAQGEHEGTTGFSIDLGQLLSSLTATPFELCSGGLQADRAWYHPGQTVLLGYRNDGGPGWYGVEIHSAGGAFLRWLGWHFVDTGRCGTWFWDQRDASGLPMSPGLYTAKLWDGTSYIESVGFQIRPGFGLSVPATNEITVGDPAFGETVVGRAMDLAIDRLTSALLLSLEGWASQALDRAPAAALERREAPAPAPEGQVAAILPDGRIAVTLGRSVGITSGDTLEVLEVENLVVDPVTSAVLAYDVVGLKGELVVRETRDHVSYAVTIGAFVPRVGDVVRAVR